MMYDRYRTRGGLLPHLSQNAKWWNTTNGVTGISQDYSPRTVLNRIGSVETMADCISRDFAKNQAKGVIFNNPMTQSKMTVTSYGDTGWKFYANPAPESHYWGDHPADWCIGTYGPPAQAVWPSELIDELRGLAVTKAHANVQSPAVYGGVFLGEMRETIRMFKKPLSGLQDFIRNRNKWDPYRGRKPQGSRKNRMQRGRKTQESLTDGLYAASQSWLEARLGWRPFLLELDALRKELETGQFNERYTARGQSERTVEVTGNSEANTNGVVTTFINHQHSVITCRAGILYEAYQSVPQRMGFAWSAVPATAYELIPFSFVVDWFVNLGDYIQALTPKVGVRHLCSWTSLSVVNRSRRTATGSRFHTGWVVQRHCNGVDEALYETKTRSPGIPFPELVVTTDMKHALRNNRGWDALSLFIQQISSPKGRPKWTR